MKFARNYIRTFCLIFIITLQNVIIESAEIHNGSLNINNSADEFTDHNDHDRILLENYLKNANIALEQNNIWLEKLRGKNLNEMPLLSTITLKYEIRDIIKFIKGIKDNLRQNFKLTLNLNTSVSELIVKQYELITKLDYNVLPLKETFVLNDILEFNKIEINFCRWNNDSTQSNNCTLNGKDLYKIFTECNDLEQLKFYFNQFMKKLGSNKMEKYEKFLELFNKAAVLNGFNNSKEMLTFPYYYSLLNKSNHKINLDDELKFIMDEIKPFHEQLHGFIRYQLRKEFNTAKETLIIEDGPIPDYLHQKLIANSYAENLQFLGLPITTRLEEENSNMPKPLSNDFKASSFESTTKMLDNIKFIYQRLGFDINKMPLFVKVNENHSHPKFSDSFGRKELKLDIGTDITRNQFSEIFLEFFKYLEFTYSYNNQPWIFRKLLPRAFSKSIANALRLGIENITFIDMSSDYENRIMIKALQTILPIQSKYITSETLKCLQTRKVNDTQCEFWSEKLRIQGILSDKSLNDSSVLAWKFNGWDKDDYEDITSIILGYQIFEGLCEKIGFKSNIDFLANCQLSGRSEIGDLIKKIFIEGASISWKDQIKNLLPQNQQNNELILSAKSMLKYFKPLYEWLEEYNRKENVKIGW